MNTSSPTGTLTIDELAEAAATSTETVRAWRDLGLLSRPGDALTQEDVERARLLEFVQRRGIAPEVVARACQSEGDLLGQVVHSLLRPVADASNGPQNRWSLANAGVATGLDPRVFQRLWIAAGLSDQVDAYDDDIEALRWLRTALDAGLPEDALVQIVRVFADALGRVADAEARLFHYYVHERLRAEGLVGSELTAATDAVSRPLQRLVEPAVLYFHRKAYHRALREDLLLHLAEDVVPPAAVPGKIETTILFVDLSGFTPLTEAMGDAAAAGLMERFSELVRDAARRSHGTVVKQIGDEFMLAFPEPSLAVSCGLEMETTTSAQPQFPAVRIGAHAGAALYREGDYVGTTVNVAARVAAEAERHQFLVTAAVRPAAEGKQGIDVVSVGARELKGLVGRLELFAVSRRVPRAERTIDPVCLMELDPSAAAARLAWHGSDLRFCSDDCLRLFVDTPDRYRAPP